MEKLEIICVVLKRNESHRNLKKLFESLLELDKYIECTPSVRYQLHGLQKATDPIKLFIFCLNKDDVQERFQIIDGESDIDVDSFSLNSLNEVWKQTDRWSPVQYICWYDVRTTDNADEIDNLTYLFLTCIPPSSVTSSVCVLTVTDNDYHGRLEKIKAALSSCKIRTKTSNVITFCRLKGTLNTLLADRLESVRSNVKYVIEYVEREIDSKKTIEIRNMSQQTQHSIVTDLILLSPTDKEVLEVMVNDFPKVDKKILKWSMNLVFIKRYAFAMLSNFAIILFTAFLAKLFRSSRATRVHICKSHSLLCGRNRLYVNQIIDEYYTSIGKLDQKVLLINKLYDDLGQTDGEEVRSESKDGFPYKLDGYL